MDKFMEALKKVGGAVGSFLKMLWNIIKQYAPIVLKAVWETLKAAWRWLRDTAIVVWNMLISITAKLLQLDPVANKRAVTVTLCSFIAFPKSGRNLSLISSWTTRDSAALQTPILWVLAFMIMGIAFSRSASLST